MALARRMGDAIRCCRKPCRRRLAVVATTILATMIVLVAAAGFGSANAMVAVLIAALAGVVMWAIIFTVDHIQTLRQELQEKSNANTLAELRLAERFIECDSLRQRLAIESAEKDAFVRSTAHDLSAPLRNISGMAAALLLKHGHELSPDAARRLHRIRANADAEQGMINDLLELARLKAASPRNDVIDLDALVTELIDVFENDLISHRIDLRIDGQLPIVRGDRVRLRQIFQNLIDNAIKYMGEGPIRQIRIGGLSTAKGVTCYVSDTGAGIDVSDRTRLFHLFRRGRSYVAATQPGTGLGLAGVKSIVESHDGTIRYAAREHGGSVFTFTLGPRFIGPARTENAAKAVAVS